MRPRVCTDDKSRPTIKTTGWVFLYYGRGDVFLLEGRDYLFVHDIYIYMDKTAY